MKIKNIIILAGILIILLVVIIAVNKNKGGLPEKVPLCIVDKNKPFTKVGTCETNEDCPKYASVCELGEKKCMAPNYITEKNITYAPSAESEEECVLIGGSWKLIGKELLNPR